jgi:hypothetical protein
VTPHKTRTSYSTSTSITGQKRIKLDSSLYSLVGSGNYTPGPSILDKSSSICVNELEPFEFFAVS